jgi:hypothetical protein
MTKNEAAAEVRHEILRKMRSLEKRPAFFPTIFWLELATYVKGMAVRASKKRGGLGRR